VAAPIFIFAAESIFTVEVMETLHRLGRKVAGTFLTGEPEWDLSALRPMKSPELTVELLTAATVVPWVTPGLKWQKVIKARKLGFHHFPALADPSAIVASTVQPEEGVFLNAGATIGAYARLASFVLVNRNASIGHHSVVGPYASLGPGVTVAARCAIGKGTMIGSGAIIAPGVNVGENCLIAAGAVITRDVPDRMLMAGNPARAARSDYGGFKDVLVE
jgi:sugar O-acyltransferase (sialic acid O-acetyltransferase NeuD family)